ncbi:peptidylprolyl isomerase [Helicobacter sp. 11S03491-1]|uniref:peptidylprolyl isomerase n=1 Tax=Helicobacter sp. 11S03491-1 TaxID=1476196 RepID=UPI000BA68068|nr:peptidylprolyl isomerase [Helicobacter sp. 11S03491-1]PAF41103.1 hypothetical protein BKH45_08230 [Helicobacter sp. 11S03491-1]
MIEWMQKHKKYLVITIWISTIAFIAAGMIGWGQYNFSISGDSIAKVGQIEINAQEYNQEYTRIYNAYAQALGNDFDQEQAKAIGLDKMAIEFLINQALLRNFALDLGLRIKDSEVIDEITHTDTFQNNGHFDEVLYKKILQDNNYRPSDFEKNVRNALLMQKITALLPDTITPLELDSVSLAFKLQDKLEILILDTKNIKPKISDTELKDFWTKNKNDYQNPAQFEIQYIFVKSGDESFSQTDLQNYYNENKSLYLDDKGELETFKQALKKIQKDFQMQKAQSQAIKDYLALKKNEAKNIQNKTIIENTPGYSTEIMQALQNAKINDTIKPLPYEDGYITFKLITKKDTHPKSFEEAKQQALKDLEETKKMQLLKLQAQNQLDNFKGKSIGFVSAFKGKIEGLDTNETASLIKQVFSSQKKSNFAIINQKAVLYRIIDQDFKAPLEDENTIMLMTKNFKAQYFDKMLIDYLKQKYTIKRYQY